MNKADLIAKVSAKSGQTKKLVEEILVSYWETVASEVKAGGEVKTPNGTYKLTHRAARTGINPQTKQPMKIAASKAPVFKASAGFKTAVNG